MRDWFILAVVFAPVLVLGLFHRSGIESPDWIRVIGIAWFVAGSLYIGWYDGWVKRALLGILIFIPLAGILLWWSGALPSGWPTAINILLIATSIAILIVLGLWTGWFAEVAEYLRRTFAKDHRHAKDV
jgi:hypothetical protein